MESQYTTQHTATFIGDKTYPARYVSVVFGNPRSEECAGYGICRLDEDWPIPGQTTPPPKPPKDVSGCLSNCCRGVAMIERLETTDGTISLLFRFLKSHLTPETVKKHFNATHFRVGSDILLPMTLIKAFDLDPSVFSAGLYEIIETKTYFQIQLQIS